jgi:SAM-dependent methyltransferase
MSADDIVGLYERHALEWVGDRSRQTKFFEQAWLDRFAAPVPAGGTILDLGCGPGKPMAAYLLSQDLDVCGVDSSPTMISMCRENFSGHQWIVADMRTLALRRRYDGVMAWDSFFHLSFDDQRRMFPVFRDHASPDAPLLFTSGPRHGEAIGNLRGKPLYHASLDPDEYRTLLGVNGFSAVAYAAEDPNCGGHTVWLARRDKDR